MKPINYNKESCNPISSNCVVWQGPDIACIKICNGDTVSDVVYKLATELCTVLDTLDVANYDLSCFNITACGPSDFQQLIQFLIQQICELQNIDPTPITPGNPLKEIITVDPCFVDELGETTTLEEYVHAIAQRVCSIILQIAVINSTLIDYGTRITILESYFPLPTPGEPQITPDCVLPSVPTNISTVLQALELAFCNLINVTGNDTDLYNAIISQCVADGDPRKDGGGVMSSIPGWFSSPVANIAESITNLWLTVCDLRAAANPTVAVSDTQTVDMTITAGPNYVISADVVDTGWVDLNGFNYYGTAGSPTAMTAFKPKCRRIGNVIHFKGQVVIPMSTVIGGATLELLSSSTAYYGLATPYVFQGVDATYGNGCTLNVVDGGLTFNLGTSVVPTAVWSGPLDDVYSMGSIIAIRPINLNTDYGTSLSAVFTVNITSAGALVVGTVKDYEITVTRAGGLTGTSHLRYITSNVNAGDYVANYTNEYTNIHSLPSTNFAQSSGTIAGTVFTDTTHQAGVFAIGQTLVGPGVADGTKIIGYGTGTGANNGGTYDINISQVVGAGTSIVGTADITLNSISTNTSAANVSTTTWPFSCDAGESNQIGGFSFRLDGLMAYVAP
jgi:hypothetical protein